MAFFQPVNVQGPAHRGATIQMLAQNAAKSLAMRQRLRGIIHEGSGAAGGAVGGAGSPTSMLRGSFVTHAVGGRGGIQRPGISAQQLQDMISRAQGQFGTGPDGRFGGMTNPSGGGYDFGSLPDAGDPHQSPASIGPTPVSAPPAAPAPSNSSYYVGPDGTPQQTSVPTNVPAGMQNIDSGVVVPTANGTAVVGSPQANGASIPLGGGLYYDPIRDVIHGMPTGK